MDFRNFLVSLIKWSDGKTNKIGSEPFSMALSAAMVIAGAVLRAKVLK